MKPHGRPARQTAGHRRRPEPGSRLPAAAEKRVRPPPRAPPPRGALPGERHGRTSVSSDRTVTAECPLPRCRQHDLGWQSLPDAVVQPESHQSGRGQHDGGPIGVRIELGEAGIDVAAEIYDLEIGPGPQQLGSAPEATGGDDRSPGHLGPAERPVTDQGVARILPGADCRHRDARLAARWVDP